MTEHLPGSRADHDAVRALPSDPESEAAVLASMLADPPISVLEGTKLLRAEHFYTSSNRVMFEVLVDMAEDGAAIDPVTFQSALVDRELIDKAGGPGAVAGLISITSTPAHLKSYAEAVIEKALRRSVLSAGAKMMSGAYEFTRPVEDVLNEAEGILMSLRQDEADSTRHVRDVMPEVIDRVESITALKGEQLEGIHTGFTELDRMTGGWKAGQQIVIGGRPSMGKTTLLMNMLECAVFDHGHNALLFTMEMSAEEVLETVLLRRAEVGLTKLRNGFFSKGDLHRLGATSADIVKGELYIDDTPNISIQQMRVKAKLLRLKLGHLDLVGTDYLQLASSATRTAAANRQIEIAEISRGGKLLAREIGCAHLIAAQVGRGADERAGGLPKIADLRESGAIEQDADVVVFISRPGRHKAKVRAKAKAKAGQFDDEEDDEEEEIEDNEGTIYLAKQRRGKTDVLKPVDFIGDLALFKDRPKEEGGGGGRLYN